MIYPEFADAWSAYRIWIADLIDDAEARGIARRDARIQAWNDYVWAAVDHARLPRRGSRRTLRNYLKFHPFFLK